MQHNLGSDIREGATFIAVFPFAVPARPENLTQLAVGDSWAQLAWSPPLLPNGVIIGYYMYYEFVRGGKNITDNRIIKEAHAHMRYNLTGLGECC